MRLLLSWGDKYDKFKSDFDLMIIYSELGFNSRKIFIMYSFIKEA
jgi:hypothetical protein